MNILAHRSIVCVTLAVSALLICSGELPALADYRDYGYRPYAERPLLRNPVVRQSLIGAGLGAVTGAVSREGSIVRSAGLGAITGAATGAIDYTGVLDGRPLARRAAKGAVIGVGTSAVTRRDKVTGAVVGAGAGAAYHVLKRRSYDY